MTRGARAYACAWRGPVRRTRVRVCVARAQAGAGACVCAYAGAAVRAYASVRDPVHFGPDCNYFHDTVYFLPC